MSKAAALKSLPSGQLKGVNLSGIRATEFKVVILPDKEDKFIEMKGPDGKIVKFEKPDTVVDQKQAAAVVGTIVDVSPLAFRYEVWPEGATPPQVGDRVLFAKYCGMKHTGKDGLDYLVMNDKDIAAVIS